VRNPYEPVKISTKPISRDTALLLTERSEVYPGVRIDAESVREYVEGPLYSPIIGYTGPITEDELQAKQDLGYLPTDAIGRTGLEWEYEQYLRGQYGWREIERDASQREIKTLAQTPPQPGGNVVLTIDDRLQNLLATELNAGVKRGCLHPGRGGRDEPAERRDPRDGLDAVLRQQHVRPRDHAARARCAQQRRSASAGEQGRR